LTASLESSIESSKFAIGPDRDRQTVTARRSSAERTNRDGKRYK
jgi:hypothetical protein